MVHAANMESRDKILYELSGQMKMHTPDQTHKMRSAQTPFGAWAIMKKFILYAVFVWKLYHFLDCD